jgi:starch-binding outer membrane protein, SusD/RagB family
MKNKQIFRGILLSSFLFIGTTSCTDLEEQALDGTIQSASSGSVNTAAFLQTAYNGLRGFQDQDKMFALDEISTDALVGPTRGGDWDDNGAWRAVHTQTWDPLHVQVINSWNALLSNVYNCDQVINNNGAAGDVVQARFLRAFYYFNVVDLYGQAPYRPAGSSKEDDAKVWSRSEATNFIISELEAILPTLPIRVSGDPSIANQDAARFMLAKTYLNKAVFNSSNPGSGSFTFASSDMTKVVQNVDAMTNSLATNYWDNFAPNNNNSNELVFTSKNVLGAGGGIQSRWRMAQHYNQTPGGWNGFSTVAEYYDRYNPNDNRIKYSTPAIISEFGNPVGMLIGQMKNGKNRDAKGSDKDAAGNLYTTLAAGTINLEDRNSHPLFFTKALTLITSGATLETAGIRGLKYIPDAANLGAPDNDYVLMRYSDALLMKAEAIARGGSGSLGSIMSDIAARTGQPAVTGSLNDIYAERGRELWWEGWRRNDMIRFGKFLAARELKPYVSADKYAVFPIPAGALLNPNLKQNPGY